MCLEGRSKGESEVLTVGARYATMGRRTVAYRFFFGPVRLGGLRGMANQTRPWVMHSSRLRQVAQMIRESGIVGMDDFRGCVG
jgi:hypothetical protein